jgi:hypothetical protein
MTAISLSNGKLTRPLLPARFVIFRSLDGGPFQPIGIQLPDIHRYSDFLGKSNVKATYRVIAEDWQNNRSALSPTASAASRELTDDELLTMLQEASFQYYWEGADPHSGMARENIPGDDRIVATVASGMGICALIVSVDRHLYYSRPGVGAAQQDCLLSGKGAALPWRMVPLHEWGNRTDHACVRDVR